LLGDIEGKNGVTIADALEILKHLANMKSAISTGGKNSEAWKAALITPASKKSGNPAIGDALEILKFLAGMGSQLKDKPTI